MSLLVLPNELLLEIGESIVDPKDFISFAKACSHLNTLLRSSIPEAFVRLEDNATIPLYWAAATGNEALIKTILRIRFPLYGIFVRDDEDPSWLHHYPGRIEPEKALGERILKCGARIKLQGFYERTVLDTAVERRSVRLVAAIVGVLDPRASYRNRRRDKALDSAFMMPHVEILELLLPTAHLHYRGTKRVTPLHMAVKFCSVEAVRLLLERGASVTARDFKGQTPIHYAARDGNEAVLKVLISSRPDAFLKQVQVAVSLARKSGHYKIVKYLLYESPRLTGVDRVYGGTKLHIAVGYCDEELVAKLLDEGADVTAKDNSWGTPLHFAAKHKNLRIIGLLIKNGADVSARDLHGKTPLHVAVKWKVPSVVWMLLQEGADVNAQDHHMWTPLDIATILRSPKIMLDILRNNGARLGIELEGQGGVKT